MKLFETTATAGHEQVLFCNDQASGLKAIIAIHDSRLGAAMGATRLWPYESEVAALTDALRLSRGMTYKAACANIPMGGGKAVIIAKPEQKTCELLQAYGRFIERLNGRFITGQDINLTPQDVRQINRETKYVVGTQEKSGGPAPVTAIGVLLGMKAAAKYRFGSDNLKGLKVAVQGLGNVGQHLCDWLHQNEVKLFVSDINQAKVSKVARLYGATAVEPEQIYGLDVDIFAPCAMGAILNTQTISQMKASIIAGSANNQLLDEQVHGEMLTAQDILYCPDYVINAGGLINVYHELIGYQEKKAISHVHSIYDTLLELFKKAETTGMTTHKASMQLAEERITQAEQAQMLVSA
ncbi:tryptophan dehydrogenase ScyB [Lyngbya sp. PCC 8106]|uniref:tryptophan dehydrogenase ScyB n=1 Tax=Lyngbya sp. (strain PCC 8106) TaxID=313612 RepID=UPI0000EAD0C4|nr:tryptophan dehydrogenase ScyB [Lyngbya sp. PCC 8106]EAW38197.1 leucine dehydrogenase [Lyngbya sp. PCC 8106]